MSLVARAFEIEPEMVAIRRKIHEYPELSFCEHGTTELVERELQRYGIETIRNGNETGMVGLLKGNNEGKNICIRCDIDALPMTEDTGLPFSSRNEKACHSCGHDIHTTIVLACARLMSERRKDINGSVKFIFQPAEEISKGAVSMIKNGAMENPKVDAIVGVHTWPELPVGSIGVRRGVMFASSDCFKITISGKGGHAAHPHKCVDLVVVAGYMITQLQTIVSREVPAYDFAVVTVGKMTAGTKENIIPSEVVLEGTIRTLNPETRSKVHASLRRIAIHTAEGLNAKADVEIFVGGLPTVCDDGIIDIVSKATTRLLGADKLVQLPYPSMGTEDFSEYLNFAPGAMIRIGTANELPESRYALHSPKIVFDEKAITSGAIALCGTILEFLGSDFS